ncbi:MAG: 3-deoxy-7-phosphoheptulonate synthase [Bradymonadaceae bacterium]|nr:3-deoxy-7-phosphoheptulonate synthase [Lujinxingiaceae bacterium]
MIIVLKPGTSIETTKELIATIEAKGLKPVMLEGTQRNVIAVIGDERALQSINFESHPDIEKATPVLTPYKLVSREIYPANTVIDVGGVAVGGNNFVVIAGPCSVESYAQMTETAAAVREAGARLLRGGVFKPRSSPYAFQGLGVDGLGILSQVSREQSMPAFTEVMEVKDLDMVEEQGAAFQIGARNMKNTRLLTAVGQRKTPVLLKRGMAATIDDLLLAAEYILCEGNPNVILCERGISTFETSTRNTLDLNAIPVLKEKTHLPVIVDPSHGIGVRRWVTPMALAAAAAGADGIMVEVHNSPKDALSDGHQSLHPDEFVALMKALRPVVAAVGRELV